MVDLLERFRLEVSHREQSALGHVSPCIRFPTLVRQPAGGGGRLVSWLLFNSRTVEVAVSTRGNLSAAEKFCSFSALNPSTVLEPEFSWPHGFSDNSSDFVQIRFKLTLTTLTSVQVQKRVASDGNGRLQSSRVQTFG